MRLLDALQQVQGVFCKGRNGKRDGSRGVGRVKRDLPRPLTTGGDKDAATRTGGICGRYRKVRAAHDAELDLRVDDESEANGILLPAEEALRAVDRVESPKAWEAIS